MVQVDIHVAGIRVPDGVGQRFLGDPETGDFDRWLEAPVHAFGVKLDARVGAAGILPGQPLQRGVQAQLGIDSAPGQGCTVLLRCPSRRLGEAA